MAYYPPRSPYETGLAGKCPRCGRGDLFVGYLKVAASCDSCQLDYAKADSGDGPAVFVIFIVGFVAVATAFTVRFGFDAPAWLALALSIGLGTFLILVMLRPLKGVMIALQYANKAREGQIGDAGGTFGDER